MKPLVLVCASEEWNTTKSHFAATPESTGETPFGEFFETAVGKQSVIFMRTGFTKTKAAAACQHGIDRFKPSIVFNIGTCGAVSSALKPLDLILATKTVQHDCRDNIGQQVGPFLADLVVEIDNSWLGSIDGVTRGVIATADHDGTAEDVALLREHSVLAVDWESGAIAKICAMNKVRCCIIRGATDHLDQIASQTSDYLQNVPNVMRKAYQRVLPVLLGRI
jgi:adenosylhomocysteine nucleosidase